MTVLEMKQNFQDNYDKIMAVTEEELLAVCRAYMNGLLEVTAKRMNDANYLR